ncbi:MAG: 16S rRNA (adenine(1518)-N(6)/adenine(1519)-N(6))-dimethyltransferase RsmA [Alphaproteobacteria bacterium]|nr:16S rRNA (adenine(1518)-N(6)/adenine(1519)-N(6))-dimethyltransferase RsmA [Alphaproteobacteria bacterium]MDA8004722.1 16S rRNA (adenine(1518)-N(6)/adenine(1519)-N(6))-dimethyltransferase RsmA [Alphaproteobacteria bacterium]MDA8006498.1 16S rRNA (adenine(1518)-N(6)/adenine(1519)-N(6))-dimethyltransferase RsmA [Alphaproteobacteria bacterium]MDA8012925.1 16S rRNA (adenine(1518)-N(6)/adenine(1519)-N(6))-dimethyltransferase RsmA [Alphaproteobacteria bacterium]
MTAAVAPRKSLGQHYLSDPAILGRIAAAALESGADGTTLEVGAGPGTLSRALLEGGAERLVLCERDERFREKLEALRSEFSGRDVVLLFADARELRLADYCDPAPLRVVGNLPYNVGTKLLTGWLSEIAGALSLSSSSSRLPVESFTLMFQDEVARRIVARAGDDSYGRLSVLCGWLAECRRLFSLSPGSFYPMPRVRSAVVGLYPRGDGGGVELAALEAVTRAAFGKRRKMLRGALARMPCGAELLLEAAGLSGDERAEDVSVESYCAMAKFLSAYS